MSSSYRSVYIHWPFCPYKCHFCPFVAIAGHDQYMGQYHTALKNEIRYFGAHAADKHALDTIFLGGGTPSTYPDDLLLDMFGTLEDVFLCKEVQEITIEVNPGTVRPEQLAIWKQAGINRLSIGVQALKDSALHTLNRKQSYQDVSWLISNASKEFSNISVDLIVGLPDVTMKEWHEMIKVIVTWPISHISIYFLTVHEDTPLYFKVQTNKLALPLESHVVDAYLWSIEQLAQHGFEQYEISNFAKPGFQSKHNRMYWERKPFRGFGLGAWSFDGMHRFQNQKNLMNYIATSSEQKHFSEELTAEQEHLEKIMLGLRQRTGVHIDDLCREKNKQHVTRFNEVINECIVNGYIHQNNDRIWLTPRGFTLHQSIVTQLSCEH